MTQQSHFWGFAQDEGKPMFTHKKFMCVFIVAFFTTVQSWK